MRRWTPINALSVGMAYLRVCMIQSDMILNAGARCYIGLILYLSKDTERE